MNYGFYELMGTVITCSPSCPLIDPPKIKHGAGFELQPRTLVLPRGSVRAAAGPSLQVLAMNAPHIKEEPGGLLGHLEACGGS